MVLIIFEIFDLKNMLKYDLEGWISLFIVYNNFFVLNVVIGFKVFIVYVNLVK